MWEIDSGKSNLVLEVVRKDSYATLSRIVGEHHSSGIIIAVHDSRYLRKIMKGDTVETVVIYPEKSQVIDPRVLRDKTVMHIQEFLANNDEGIMLVDVLEELGKRLSVEEMIKTVQTLVSFKSCKHTILATLNPVVLPKDMVKSLTPHFDSVQDVRAASMGAENVDCPNCGARWDFLVTICSMCGYNFKSHTIRVVTSSESTLSSDHLDAGPEPTILPEPVEVNATDKPSKKKKPVASPKRQAASKKQTKELEMDIVSMIESAPPLKNNGGDKPEGEKSNFLENLTFKFLSAETEAPDIPESTPVSHTQTSGVDWFSRGVSLELKGDSSGALNAYDQALGESPNDPWIWLNKGVSLQRLGRLEDALKCYDESIRLDASDPDAWSNRATALRGIGRTEEAVESYKRALEMNPDDGGIWSNLGIALRSMGRFEEALTAYESALSLTPQDLSIWLNKAAVMSSLGRYDDSMGCYDHVLELDPGNTGVRELKKFLQRKITLGR